MRLRQIFKRTARSRSTRKSATPPKNSNPNFSNSNSPIFLKIPQSKEHRILLRSANLYTSATSEKISWSKNVNFRLGGSDPQSEGPSPPWSGALVRAPGEAEGGERTVAISVTTTEKIEFKEKNSEPSSGAPESRSGPMSRVSGTGAETFNRRKFRRPRPTRSAAIRPRKNLEMAPMRNEKFFSYTHTRTRQK